MIAHTNGSESKIETEPHFYTPVELAKRWSISDRTVRLMAKDGRLSHIIVANKIRIPKNVVTLIEKGEIKCGEHYSNEEISGMLDTRMLMAKATPQARAAQTRLKRTSGQKNTSPNWSGLES